MAVSYTHLDVYKRQKYDIRSFSPNREKCGKGITLNADEAAALLKALQKELNSEDVYKRQNMHQERYISENRRFYRWTNDVAEYLEDMAGRERQAEVGLSLIHILSMQ